MDANAVRLKAEGRNGEETPATPREHAPVALSQRLKTCRFVKLASMSRDPGSACACGGQAHTCCLHSRAEGTGRPPPSPQEQRGNSTPGALHSPSGRNQAPPLTTAHAKEQELARERARAGSRMAVRAPHLRIQRAVPGGTGGDVGPVKDRDDAGGFGRAGQVAPLVGRGKGLPLRLRDDAPGP